MLKREHWTSRLYFILATAGFAIGLGNIWRFPYITGVYGGGAFVLIYLIALFLIGIPAMTVEVSIGRLTQSNPVGAFKKLAGESSLWKSIGALGLLSAFLIMSFYTMVIGWVFAYFYYILTGTFQGMDSESIGAFFGDFISSPLPVTGWTLAVYAILIVIIIAGVKKGIEKFIKYAMPLLFISLIIVSIRAITLPGALEGVAFYLTPDFSEITFEAILTAVGQVFFSVGVGMAAALVYGSYLTNDDDVPGNTARVCILDLLAALISGFAIFPAVFAYGLQPDAGPGLLFVTMSSVFSEMPAGQLFGALFFFLVLIAAITSDMALLEAITSFVGEEFNLSRKKATPLVAISAFIVGIPIILGEGPWSNITFLGRNFFGWADHLASNFFLVIGAFLMLVYVGWFWGFDKFQEATNAGAVKLEITPLWKPLIKYLLPIIIAIVFLTGIGIL